MQVFKIAITSNFDYIDRIQGFFRKTQKHEIVQRFYCYSTS